MHNLIEKVGGIEKAQKIMNGAPDWAKAYNTKMKQYTNGFIRCSSDVYLDDLRTAISEHGAEFKKGDLVIAPILDGVFVGKIIDYRSDIDKFDVLGTTHWDWYDKSQLRHAETKAEHSLDDVTDHVTDIRNHISLSTMVVDL